MKHIFFSILTVLAFWGCREAAPVPKNTLSCYVRYDADARVLKAEASLREGATKKIVEMSGGIRFQSTSMNLLPVRGLTYSLEYASAFTPAPTFEWKDQAGLPLRHNVNMPRIDSFYFGNPVLTVEESGFLRWIGTPLDKNETLVFIWDNEAEGKTQNMEVSTTLGQPLIEIPAPKMAQIGPGEWSLYLVRKRLEKTEVSQYTVESTAEFYTKPVKVKIEGE